jgi:hypothetical protein
MRRLITGKGRWIAAGVAAVTLAGGAYAFAASMTVTSTTLGAGGTTVAACNSAANVSYGVTWAPAAAPDFIVSSVTVTTAIPGAVINCAGLNVLVVLTGPTLPGGSVVLPAAVLNAAGSYMWTLPPPVVQAAAVTDVHVAIWS